MHFCIHLKVKDTVATPSRTIASVLMQNGLLIVLVVPTEGKPLLADQRLRNNLIGWSLPLCLVHAHAHTFSDKVETVGTHRNMNVG